MKSIAVLMTCFNRKEKTLECLERVYNQSNINEISIDVFLVDGGSTDGTPESVRGKYPSVYIEVVENLYWAGGMRKAWQNACEYKKFDFFLLLNDDTFIYQNCFSNLIKADNDVQSLYNKHGIYSACTRSGITGLLTYGGRKLKKENHLKSELIIPSSDEYKECDLCNGNILMIPREVYEKVGILSKHYTHSIADWDYSLRVKRAGFPVLVIPGFQGECERDHGDENLTHSIPLKKRIYKLKYDKGGYHEFLDFTKEFFPKDYYYMKALFWFRTLCPITYKLLKRL